MESFFQTVAFCERQRNWTGLLIEPTGYLFERLLRLHRKYAVNACSSVEKQISIVKFYGADLLGGTEEVIEGPILDRKKLQRLMLKQPILFLFLSIQYWMQGACSILIFSL